MDEIFNVEGNVRTLHEELSNAKALTSTIFFSLKLCNKNISLVTIRNNYIPLLNTVKLPTKWQTKAVFYIEQFCQKKLSIEETIEFFTNSEKQLHKSLKLFNEEAF